MVEVRQKARRRRRRRGGGGAATDIKSNNPHLAGGKQSRSKDWMTPHVKSSCAAQCKLQVQRLEKSLLHVPRSRFDRAKLHTNQFDSDHIERGSLTASKKKIALHLIR